MAVLTPGKLALALGVVMVHASAAIPSVPTLEHDAYSSLKRCEFRQAEIWAVELDRVSPGLAGLYRLAWVQQLTNETIQKKQEIGPQQVVWKYSAEVWRDERTDIDETSSCATKPPAIALSGISDEVRQEIIPTLLSHLRSLPPEARHVLADWLVERWQRGLKEKWDLDKAPHEPEWRALAFLHQGREYAFPTEPPTLKSQAVSAWAVRLGDRALEEGRYAAASEKYASALLWSPLSPSPALWYRVATARIGLATTDLATLRAALAALSPKDGERSLRADYRTQLSNQTCTWLGQFDGAGTRRALRRVAGSAAWRAQAHSLLQSCSAPGTESVAEALLPGAKTPRERAQLTAKLMGQAERAGRRPAALGYAKHLAKLSANEESLANHYFWKELTPGASSLVTAFRSGARWTAADEARSKRLRDEMQPTPVQTIRSNQVLLLPAVSDLPQTGIVEPKLHDFVAIFARATEQGIL